MSATFQSDETVNGESNGSNSEAEEGEPGLEGTIDIEPGDRMPFVPRHMIKAFADVRITDALWVDVDVVGVSGSFARGNENNEHEPDGTYYLNEGTSPGYAVVNLGARYRLTRWLQVIGQINNLFDRQYPTGAQLGAMGFTDEKTSSRVRSTHRWRVPDPALDVLRTRRARSRAGSGIPTDLLMSIAFSRNGPNAVSA